MPLTCGIQTCPLHILIPHGQQTVEAAWPSGLGRWISTQSPRVQIPLWPVAGVVSQ